MPAPQGRHGLIVLLVSFAIISMGTGTVFALSVFLLPIVESMSWTRSDISIVAGLNWLSLIHI